MIDVPMIEESEHLPGFFLFLIDFDSDFEKKSKNIWRLVLNLVLLHPKNKDYGLKGKTGRAIQEAA
jgi:hypothetical protein